MEKIRNIFYLFLGFLVLLFIAASIATFMLVGGILVAIAAVIIWANNIKNRIRRYFINRKRRPQVG